MVRRLSNSNSKTMKKLKVQETGDFAGVPIYVGIDVHQKQWNVSVCVRNRKFAGSSQPPDVEKLYNYLERTFPGGTYICCYEAGCFGFGLCRSLENLGVRCLVINPSDVPTTNKEKMRKSDRVDSRKLAQCLSQGLLHNIYVPSEQQESDREVVRFRSFVAHKEWRRWKQRIRSFLMRKGRTQEIEGYTGNWSRSVIETIGFLEWNSAEEAQVLSSMLRNFEFARAELLRANRSIVVLSRTPRYLETVSLLRSIPGIGILTAMTLVTELGEMSRFASLDHLCSFVGIVPDMRSSAEKESNLGLTRRAHLELRRLLVQSAWVASGRSASMCGIYNRSLSRSGIKQKAIIRVCRKLLSVIRAVWTTGKKYEEGHG